MRGRVVVAMVAVLAAACSSGDDATDQLAVDVDGSPATTESDALTRIEGSDDTPASTDAVATGEAPSADDDQGVATNDAPNDPEAEPGDEPDQSEPESSGSGAGGDESEGGSSGSGGSGGDDGSSTATTVDDTVPTTEGGGSNDGGGPAATTTPAGTTASGDVEAFFPDPQIELVQGGEVWAVVLAGAAAPDDAALRDAELVAEDAGYRTGPTDCDVGAPEALGLGAGGVFTVSVYFPTEGDARSAAAAFGAQGVVAEVALVQTFCLD